VTCKNKKNASEINDRGVGDIHKDYLLNRTREEYTQPWNDNYIIGTMWALHKYATKTKPLSYQEIERIIGWKWRTIKNGMESLRKCESSLLKNTIKTVKYDFKCFCCGCKSKYYINEKFIKNMDITRLIRLFYKCHYGKDDPNSPNFCEACLLEICNSLYKDQFIYTGTQTAKNRIGRYYPDISHIKYPILIEHNGSPFHQDKKREDLRRKYLESQGYYLFVVTDYKIKNKTQETKKIKEFVDNAIQDIQQLAV